MHALQRLAQKDDRIRAFPLRVGRRKQRANIGRGDGPEQRVGNGMQQHVAVGVPAQSLVMRQRDAANLQRNARTKFVRIKAVADAGRWSFVVGRWHCEVSAESALFK